MTDKSDLVINHLNVLHKHKELIAAAYHGGAVDASDDPDGGRGIYKLNEARILVPYREGTYRLASSLSKHLDEVLHIERLYSVAGSDVADLERRLPEIASLVANAVFEGRMDDVDHYIDEFDRAVFELADSVTSALQQARILADNRFANVSTYAEKRHQNEFYLTQVERIGQALGTIQSDDLLHSLQSTPEGERLLESYQSQIADNLPQWRAQLLDITAILREYLFRIRQIELLARQMLSFELFLKRTPNYVPKDIDVASDMPTWSRYALGFSLISHANVNNTAQDELLLDIARSIPVVTPPNTEPPRSGTLLQDEPLPSDEGDISRPWQEAISALLVDAHDKAISVLEWKSTRPEIANLENDIWLLCLLHEEALRRKRSTHILFEPITAFSDNLSGTIIVTDILISRRGSE